MKFSVERVTALAGLVVCSSAFPEHKLTVNNHKLLISSQVTNCLYKVQLQFTIEVISCSVGLQTYPNSSCCAPNCTQCYFQPSTHSLMDFQSKLLRHGQSILDKMPLIMGPYKMRGLFSNSIYATNDRNHSFL